MLDLPCDTPPIVSPGRAETMLGPVALAARLHVGPTTFFRPRRADRFPAGLARYGPRHVARAGRPSLAGRARRAFARAIGILARTDRGDARVLAEMAHGSTFRHRPVRAGQLRLADFLRRRRPPVEIREAETVRRHRAGRDAVAEAIVAMLDLLSARVDALDRKIAALIAEDHGLRRQAEPPAAVPGIGPVVLATTLGELPAHPRRAVRARQPVPPPDRPACPARAPHARPRDVARRQAHPAWAPQGPRSPRPRRAHRTAAHPGAREDARAPEGQGRTADGPPDRLRRTAPRHPRRASPEREAPTPRRTTPSRGARPRDPRHGAAVARRPMATAAGRRASTSPR